ncbi:hypothetical protein ACVJBD_007755 [Rhizobium mongolense]
MPRIIEENFTFVTNNARDFRKLYAKEESHPRCKENYLISFCRSLQG